MRNAANEKEAARLQQMAAVQSAAAAKQDALARQRAKRKRLQTKLDRGFIQLTSTDPNLQLVVFMGDGGANLMGGFGGWAEVQRPRRIAFTEWQGLSPYRMDVPVLFFQGRPNGLVTDDSVEADVRKLERMAIPFKETGQPPQIRIQGAVPKTELTWVVESIDWGDGLRQPNGFGNLDRLRQAATIHFIHYESSETSIKVKGGTASRQRAKSRNSTSKVYTVKSGDTLTGIASRRLGSAKRWKDIQRLNPSIRDPDKLTPGQTLKMPAK